VSTPAQLAIPRARGSLLRILGIGFGIAIGIGTVIGGGIMRTPGEVAADLGTAQLTFAAWVFGGVYALLGTILVSELATALPRAGGW
jgi:APA family basic amino acid/polyamine antiporter